jgi:2-iminobutanoate/2-iminopropanoate deaminase
MSRTPLLRVGVSVALTLAAACSPTPPPPPSAEAATSAQAGTTQIPAPTQRRVISTPDAPAAIGPYSQAIQVGQTLYLAGQIALDPASGAMVTGGIEAETRQVMENLGAVLEAAGFGFGDVVQSQVFLTNLDDFGAMNGVYEGYFGEGAPARATVGVAALPRGARVEILMTAAR